MQQQNMCKKGHGSFKEYAQRWRDLAAPVASPLTEKEMITVIVDTLPVFHYEKMVRYAPSSFADLVFADKRIEADLKIGKFDHPALMNEKTGANEEDENDEGIHVEAAIPTWPNFPSSQQCHYLANISPSHYLPPGHPQRLSPNHPQSLLTAHPMPKRKPKHQPRNEFCSEKSYRIHPNSCVLC